MSRTRARRSSCGRGPGAGGRLPRLRRGNVARARLSRADGGRRSRRRPARGGEGAGAPDALPGPGLHGADVPRAGLRCPGAVPAAHLAADGPGQRGGTRISRRASARLLPALGIGVSRHTALRVLLKIPLPALAVPRVLGIDDFALRRGLVYATILIDAGTGRRVDVLEGRTADVSGRQWLRAHPGIEAATRDGSGAYGEAIRSAFPESRAGQRPMALVARPGRGRLEGRRGPFCLLGGSGGDPDAGGQTRRDHARTLAAGSRHPRSPGRRPR